MPTSFGAKELKEFLQLVDHAGTEFQTPDDCLNQLKEFLHGKDQTTSVTRSAEQRDIWINAQASLVKKYEQFGRKQYEELTAAVQGKCKQLLASLENGSNPLLYQEPSARTKQVDSLRDKLKRETPKMRAARTEVRDVPTAMAQLHKRVMDMSGVRILVYFPDDVPRVLEKIIASTDDFVVSHNAVVSYSRRREDHRKKDKSSHLKGGQINYTDGAFAEESASTGEVVHRWRNSGYRAVHLHVRFKRSDALVPDDKEIRSGDTSSDRGPEDMGVKHTPCELG
jgi:ppGpp synthetase/RelA/SpoT-type nucleotidyltranferase